jgi:pyruvate/2-oxoglutarate dehydrogenase complex dihydrolipoamide acyltransferase (E2) component
MPSEIVMPKLSEGMTEGSIVSWEKASGNYVEPGDILAILESDGRQTRLPSFVSGILQKIIIQPGSTVPVGTIIAHIEISRGDKMGEVCHDSGEAGIQPDRAALTRHLCDAWQSVPHFAVTVHIDMEAVETICRTFRDDGVRITVNDVIIKACVAALLKFPQVNSSLTEQGIVRHHRINIGIALSLQHGAVTPVLKECSGKTLHELARESRVLMDRARKGGLTAEETTGGTFTVANLGMYGVDEYLTVVRAPEAAILAVGAVRNAPVIADGRVVAGRLMTATLCADHRLLDGADAGLFMAELRRLLQHPAPALFTGNLP